MYLSPGGGFMGENYMRGLCRPDSHHRCGRDSGRLGGWASLGSRSHGTHAESRLVTPSAWHKGRCAKPDARNTCGSALSAFPRPCDFRQGP